MTDCDSYIPTHLHEFSKTVNFAVTEAGSPINDQNTTVLVILEAMLGQIYLVVLIARLVGLHVSGRGR
jgi:hypothetical protein